MKEIELDWETYEEVTKYIYGALGEKVGVKMLGHGSSCKVTGKSGVEHQIDVLTSHSDGIHTYKTAIECKYWKETVNKDIVMKLAEIIEDAGINKGVIVSKEGYTKDAISYASYRNIGLVELREIRDEDPVQRPPIVNITTAVFRAEIIQTIFQPSLFNKAPANQEEVHIDTIDFVTYTGEKRSMEDYVSEFKKEILDYNVAVDKVIEKKISLPMTRLINRKAKTEMYIDGFVLKGKKIEMPSLKFYPADEIWLFMKSIFEEKSFTISRLGVIKENSKKV